MTSAAFQNILAVCDPNADEGETLALAAELAQRSGARLTLFAALDQAAELDHLVSATGADREQLAERLKAEARGRIQRAWQDVGGTGDVPVQLHLGKPFVEVIRAVQAHGHDLVLKTAESLHGIHRFLLASTDQHLLRKCPATVWLHLPHATRPVHSVLATVDLDTKNAGQPETLDGLNQRILETAIALAAFQDAHLHVLHVWEGSAETLVRRWSGGDDAADDYLRSLSAARLGAMDKLVDTVWSRTDPATRDRVQLTPHVVRGAPRAEIPRQVSALGADLVVLGTIARTGVPGFLIGNTAEDVLNSVGCSVVTLKPPGYVSPLSP
jgi:nucleotide-binding universal stress UspA family protein